MAFNFEHNAYSFNFTLEKSPNVVQQQKKCQCKCTTIYTTSPFFTTQWIKYMGKGKEK